MTQKDTAKKSVSLSDLKVEDLYRMQVRELRTYAMFTLDPHGMITSWNAGVEHLLGYSEQEWVGRHAAKSLRHRTGQSRCANRR